MLTPERGGRRSQLQVTLAPEQRATLERWLRRQSLPYGLHKRVRAVLLAATGMQITEIARRVGLERRHVYRWVRRFQERGIEGLLDTPRHSPVHGRWALRRREDTDGQ